ncbi:N-alpha-acetyltransferase 35, NatC auxiliary subunit isoform X2 [Apis dorsata]|uniref:N-alpha-acetyltransferase 35, NatC auxiliary subunit isoform X2 n=1 Tax=Apis dorsata TaxID=7462 RepID=UPI0003DF57D6|nr:N-alpha-acetyltransferase 35, NatC auxiliary subunit isoform X2 [Apis dorsata]XP_016905340.1 N-alpha-acetyltransferase 35, NatC auxiliary subunit isoform X2 [Apis cerana]
MNFNLNVLLNVTGQSVRMATMVEEQNSVDMGEDKESQFDQVTYNWVDITQEFFDAITELELGELLRDELFGLFEAMSAIEMMDPKMDVGMLCNRGNSKPCTFTQAVDSGALKLDNLTPSEVIGIIDSTYACIVSWLEGHSLAQTVFTNLYLHQPSQIVDKPLKTFCYAVYKIIEIIKDCINKALVFEEEDFQSVTYGYRLQQDITEQKIISMLREVEDELPRKSRIKPIHVISEKEYSDRLALYARIRFTKLFYQILSLMGKKEQLQQNLNDCHTLLSRCSYMIQIMIKTVNSGEKADEISNYPNIMGFDPMVNQRLLPPTFPRYTKIKPRLEALKYLDELLNRFRTVTMITNQNGFHAALDFFLEFSRQSPCILSRSMLQIVYLPTTNRVFGVQNFADVLKDAARSFIAPPVLMPKSTLLQNHQAKEYVDSFMSHCVGLFGSLLQLTGHNRARQRDKLAHLLDDFAILQDEAERVDGFLHTLSWKSDTPRSHLACFGTWILYHTLRVMVMYLLSGFELELYSVHEYHYIFWYLYEFLYGWLVSAITRANTFLMEQDVHNDAHKGRGGKKSAKNKKKKSTSRPYNLEILMYQAMQNICGGYYKALVGFRMDGKIPLPESPFDSERVRYEHRLLPFSSLLTPPPVHYQEFLDMTNAQMHKRNVTSEMLYLAGCRHFHQARNMLERALSLYPPNASTVNEINDLLKVAKTNFVVLKLLADGHKKDSKEPPVFDFSCHQHFPLIKLI